VKKLTLFFFIAAVAICLTACSSTEKKQPVTIDSIISGFTAAGLTVENIEVYTAETDPNQLLGRPNQYIAKTNFTCGENVSGTIEQFSNTSDLNSRKEYVTQVTSSMSMLSQYIYASDLFLLRIDHQLTPEDAAKYNETFLELTK